MRARRPPVNRSALLRGAAAVLPLRRSFVHPIAVGFGNSRGNIVEMDLRLVEELMQAGFEDSADGRVVQVRAQHSAKTLGFIAEIACFTTGNAVQGIVELVGAKAYRTRKLSMQDEELCHLPTRDLADIRLQIGLERTARSQNRHPLRDVHMAADLFSARKQNMILDV